MSQKPHPKRALFHNMTHKPPPHKKNPFGPEHGPKSRTLNNQLRSQVQHCFGSFEVDFLYSWIIPAFGTSGVLSDIPLIDACVYA